MMTHEEHVQRISRVTNELAAAVKEAADDGVPYIVLMPALLTALRESGMMPDGGLPMLPGLPQ